MVFRPKIRKVLTLLFGCSWVLLLLWEFPAVRIAVSSSLIRWSGDASVLDPTLPISRFAPEQALVPVERHLLDHPRFSPVEIHGHLFKLTPEKVKAVSAGLDRTGTRLFVDLALTTVTPEQYGELRRLTRSEPRIIHFPGLNWEHAKNDDFDGIVHDLEAIVKQGGVRGIKIWKNFGLDVKAEDERFLAVKTKNGKLLAIDDPRLDGVWDLCSKHHLIVGMHTADPPSFFRLPDAHNERYLELIRHPDWSFFNSPPFEELLAARERLYRRRRDLTFIGQHFAELAHNLKEASRLLDENPNVYLDIAQRIDELGRQPYAARRFLIKYQDRILYGTDGAPDYEKARIYWRFLETDDEYFDYHPPHKPKKGVWKIYGLGLPESVLKKIYFQNAERLLSRAGRG